jgi:hypothetical protein
MSKVTIKISGQDVQINSKIKEFIDSIVEETMSLSEVITKSSDIGNNIRNQYYYAKKYIYMPSHLATIGNSDTLTVFGEMFEKIEDILNETSVPREYESDKTIAKKYLKSVVSRYNKELQSDDTWDKDFQEINNVSDSIMSAILRVIYDSCVDEYNKPFFAETILEAINVGATEALALADSKKV